VAITNFKNDGGVNQFNETAKIKELKVFIDKEEAERV
jgi:hypothetical protein